MAVPQPDLWKIRVGPPPLEVAFRRIVACCRMAQRWLSARVSRVFRGLNHRDGLSLLAGPGTWKRPPRESSGGQKRLVASGSDLRGRFWSLAAGPSRIRRKEGCQKQERAASLEEDRHPCQMAWPYLFQHFPRKAFAPAFLVRMYSRN